MMTSEKRTSGHAVRALTWLEVEAACLELCGLIRLHHVAGVVTIARGGLVPAAIVAYRLSLPIIGLIGPYGNFNLGFGHSRCDVVIVDDVAGSGATFREVRKVWPLALLVSPFAKPQGLDACDHYAVRIEQNTWLSFPWGE